MIEGVKRGAHACRNYCFYVRAICRLLSTHPLSIAILKQTAVSRQSDFSMWCTSFVSNGNRTVWSPIRSVIMRVITKSDDRATILRKLLKIEIVIDWLI